MPCSRRSARPRPSLALLLLLLACLLSAHAEPFRAQNPGTGSLPLSGPWHFHLGDDPAFASPTLPDATWPTLQPTDTWGNQGHPGYTGFAWYRRHLDIGGPGPQLSVLIPPVDDNYELFWNGKAIGLYGGFPPHATLLNAQHAAVYDLPVSPDGGAHGVLALRVWKAQLSSLDPSSLGGLNDTPLLGNHAVLAAIPEVTAAQHDRAFRTREMLSSVVLAFGLVSLVLYLRSDRQPILFWLAVYLITDSASALQINLLWYRATQPAEQIVNALRAVSAHLAVAFILLLLFGMAREPRWRHLTFAVAALDIAVELIDSVALWFWQFSSPTLRWIDGLTTAVYTLLPLYLFVIIAAGLRRRRGRHLWPILLTTSAYSLYQIVVDLTSQGARYTGLNWAHRLDGWTFPVGSYPVGLRTLFDLCFLSALLWTVATQQAAERRRRSFLELEIKSAQEVQRVLVPERLPEVPGFSLDAAYQPAEEVGGDFFQILPTPDAGLLVVLGDVSGKGLKAAMTVSLLVGAIRSLAETSPSPAALLAGLNRRLVGRSTEGFATCLALIVSTSGHVTLANAGHLPPFLNRDELPLAGSLPLGLADGLTYDEISVTLAPGDRLTLFTDGLIEARNRTGDLFGFDRLARLMATLPTVESLRHQAIAFGQEDDITLLSILRST